MKYLKLYDMKNGNFITFSICAAIFLAAAFAVAGFLSYRAYSSSSKLEKAYTQSLQLLQRRIGTNDTQIASLSKHMAELQDRLTANFNFSNIETKNKLDAKNNSGLIAMSPEDLTRLKQTIEATELEQLRLKSLIESAGLEQLVNSKNFDPDILKEIYDRRAERNMYNAHRNYLREQNREMHLADTKRYDEKLDSLYQRARFRRRRGANSEDSNKAFEEMLTQYPDAYATAMVIAERALYFARRNTAEAENYYLMLQQNGNESYSNVILDRGVEARPNIEFNLARQYIREGRLEEANSMLGSLEQNYPSSFIVRKGSRPSGTVSQEVEKLRINMNWQDR